MCTAAFYNPMHGVIWPAALFQDVLVMPGHAFFVSRCSRHARACVLCLMHEHGKAISHHVRPRRAMATALLCARAGRSGACTGSTTKDVWEHCSVQLRDSSTILPHCSSTAAALSHHQSSKLQHQESVPGFKQWHISTLESLSALSSLPAWLLVFLEATCFRCQLRCDPESSLQCCFGHAGVRTHCRCAQGVDSGRAGR